MHIRGDREHVAGVVVLFIMFLFKIDGKLVSIETNEPFKFDVFTDKEENQKRYETIGRLIDNAVFDLLENTCQLQRVTVPVCLSALKENTIVAFF